MTKKMGRAEKAGRATARNIMELAELMYQENTKKNFYKGLIGVLSRRRIKKKKKS